MAVAKDAEWDGVDLGSIIRKDKGEKDREPMSEFVRDTDKELEFVSTGILALDLGISAKVRGGIPKGHMVMIPGPSKMGKSFITMSIARTAQKQGMSVIIIDTERGYSTAMAEGFGLDMDPRKFTLMSGPGVNSIEKVKGILVTLSDAIPLSKRENVLLIVDSWGAFVTMKTMKDAKTGNTAQDMTEAKNLNNLANVILCTGFTTVVTNHVYENTGIVFGNPTKIRGGTRLYYLSSAVILGVSRSRDKDGDKNIIGTVVKCQNEKGRLSREFLAFEFRIKMSGGLDMFYGLLPFALESGIVEKVKDGNSTMLTRRCVPGDGMYKEEDIYNSAFWKPIFMDKEFCSYIEDAFKYESNFDDNSRFFEDSPDVDAEAVNSDVDAAAVTTKKRTAKVKAE
jgi:RecA/RadA recombinase